MISIIVPLKKDQGYLKPCIEACIKNLQVEFEMIVLPDDPLSLPLPDSRVQISPTGALSPARKRNLGAQLSKGEILAFIDDDTRPLKGWLTSALKHFENKTIAAVGGPSITPSDDAFWAQVSGTVYESWMLSGSESYRYRPQRERDVDDFPSCNLLVRKSVFDEIGGFGTDFWPGEDTELCLKIVQKGFRIRYEPEAVIEHHRRPSMKKHFVQLGNYALHRGYFVKRYPETSRRLVYFVPSISLILGIGLLTASLFGSHASLIILLSMVFLYLALSVTSLFQLRNKTLAVKLGSLLMMFLSHLVYGKFFLRGLLASRLPEEKA